MSKVNISTTPSQYATAYSCERKLLKTTLGTLVLFAYLGDGAGNRIQYKTSTDDGVNWSSWNDISYGEDIYDEYGNFEVEIDSFNNIHIFAVNKTNTAYYVKLTYSGGSWSNGTPTYISAVVDNTAKHSIYISSGGRIYISSAAFNQSSKDFLYSDNGGDSWNSIPTFSDYGSYGIKTLTVGVNLWFIFQGNGKLYYNIWNGSVWGGIIEIVSGITNGDMDSIKISDSEIYVIARTTSGIKLFKYNGSTWDSGTLLSDNANDQSPALSNVGGNPVIVWRDYDGSNYDIAYRRYDGDTWLAQVNITNDATSDDFVSTLKYDATNLYITWTNGDGSPYTIYFNNIAFSTEVISDINNDFRTLKQFAFDDINNDFRMVSTLARIDILNDFRLSGASLYNLTNDFRMIGTLVRIDVDNDFRLVESPVVTEVTNDVYNLFNFVKSIVSDINNDIRTQKKEINNITNDFRMIAPFQIPGDKGFQSLGKEYIKVYIDSIEQTDVNVNTVVINKVLDDTHTASFDLGRAYDSTKPDMKAPVEIKYNNWVIYKGYITNISPADSPESIRINCNDKYWSRNKTKKYFHVGHKPQDDKDLYYSTIQEALSNECDFSISEGDFIPQTIDCFGEGESDCISTLVQTAGNYGWFYKEDETKKLWKGGKGSIININAQALNTNLDLYQIIRHQFKEDITGIINKFRVQMGEKVARTYNDTGGIKTYSGYTYEHYIGFAEPNWDSSFENTYGSITDTVHKEDMFVKYSLPAFDSELESYTDRYPPQVKLYVPGGRAFVSYGSPSQIMTEGFTIDYENKLLIFDKPLFAYNVDSDGNVINVRRPNIQLLLWKKKYYSYTSDPEEDPESDVSNPLMFFTEKMGDYSETIMGNLDLSSLTLKVGIRYVDAEGNHIVVPEWNDTEFAKDYADWELSKISDKKVSGSIDITLDTFLYYNIDLSKRIMIDGVIDDPLNITSIVINMNTFIATLNLESIREYKRTVSLQTRGE